MKVHTKQMPFCTFGIMLFFLLSFPVSAIDFGDEHFLDVSAGLIGSYNTRIVEQDNRSNFVYTDTMAGLQFSVKTRTPDFPGIYGRIALFYPFSYSFNEVPQNYKNIFRFSVDLAAGPVVAFPFFFNTSLNLIPVLHFNYLFEDRFFFITGGLGAGVQLSVPVFRKHAIEVQYMFTYDFIDAGSNASVEPLSHRYMHEVSISYSIF